MNRGAEFNWPTNLNFNLRLAEVDREKEEWNETRREVRGSNINGKRESPPKLLTEKFRWEKKNRFEFAQRASHARLAC